MASQYVGRGYGSLCWKQVLLMALRQKVYFHYSEGNSLKPPKVMTIKVLQSRGQSNRVKAMNYQSRHMW